MKIKHSILLVAIMMMMMAARSSAQTWKLVKEKDGIKVYTRDEPNSNLKSFRGEANFTTSLQSLCTRIGNLENLDWWDDDVKDVKILHHEHDKLIQYYFVYDAPWPFTDRELCVEAHITKDTSAGLLIVHATPFVCEIEERKDAVRIKNYWQRWTIQDTGNGNLHVALEGFLDPGGNIPSWLYNLVLTDTPLKVIRNLRESVTGK